MMDVAAARDIISSVRYRDWQFVVSETEGRMYLQCHFLATCADGGGETTQSSRKWLISPYMTKSELVQTAFKAVMTAEEHETRERFLYRQRPIFGPHFDVDVLVRLTLDGDAQDVRGPK